MSMLDYLKAAAELARKAQSVDLERDLMSAREEYNALREENFTLKRKVESVEEELRQARGGVFFREPWYYTKATDGSEDGPFCPHCYDAQRKLIRAPKEPKGGGGILRECPACHFNRWDREPRYDNLGARGDWS